MVQKLKILGANVKLVSIEDLEDYVNQEDENDVLENESIISSAMSKFTINTRFTNLKSTPIKK